MKAHLDVRLRDLQDARDLFRRQPFHFAQENDRAIVGRQRAQRMTEPSAECGVHRERFGVAARLSRLSAAALSITRGQDRVQRQHPRRLAGSSPAFHQARIAHRAIQPRAKRRRIVDAPHVSKRFHQRVLHHVFCIRRAAAHCAAEPIRDLLRFHQQALERARIAGRRPRNEGRVLIGWMLVRAFGHNRIVRRTRATRRCCDQIRASASMGSV